MNQLVQTELKSKRTQTALRIASVSYLNARPLIYGIDGESDRKLLLEVPAKLIELLRDNLADVALLPVVDYQRMDGLCIVPAGGIGCDGETLTVRIFSQSPINEIRTLACDIESHTSVALARIVLAEHFGIRPEFVELSRASQQPGAARLLIGDKVVCEEPVGFDHQLDLGAAWKKMTGLPFVFATWMTLAGTDLGDLPRGTKETDEGFLYPPHYWYSVGRDPSLEIKLAKEVSKRLARKPGHELPSTAPSTQPAEGAPS